MDVPRLSIMDRLHAAVLAIGGSGLICAYWIAFFHSDLTLPKFVHNMTNPDVVRLATVYMGFESAFPLADLLVAVTSALAAFYLIGRDAKAVLFGLVASGALGFLAFIDISFNLLHGLYAPANLLGDSGLQMEAVINVGCVVGATWSIWRLWGHPLRRAEDRPSRLSAMETASLDAAGN
ncbi:MAG: hypothetical protein JWO83_4835 [Caulobacteraceae bacterium]|jgi:hypothetical protein|nr:hypothetical protein [Caulobacteraceae bacterium]